MIVLIMDGMVVLCATLAVCCVVAYQVSTGGRWRTSEYSRHLMAFTASVAGILVLESLRIVAVDVFGATDPASFQWVRVAAFATLPMVLAWRLWLILTTQSVEVPMDGTFWRTLAVRAVRNAVQVMVPVLALSSAGQITGASFGAAAAAAGLAGGASALKTLSGLTADAGASLPVQVAERALGAAAGAVVAVWPLSLDGVLHAGWAAIGVAAASAAGLSVLQWVLEHAPADPVVPVMDGAGGGA